MIKCSFCGYEFQDEKSRRSCSECPLSSTCNKYKGPNCGFEIPNETTLIKLIKKWRKKSE